MTRPAAGRLALFTIVLAWMQAGPVLSQALGLPRPIGTSTWRMYSTKHADICTVRYVRLDDGSEIDRFATLGQGPWYRAEHGVRFLHGEDHVRRVGERLCKAVGDVGVGVVARCGHRNGWTDALDGTEDLCEAPPSARRGRRRR